MKHHSTELEKDLTTLKESVDFYLKAQSRPAEQKAFRDASIQRFEYCIELAWKASMKILGSTTQAPKPAIREMARNNLISNPDTWLKFIEARNDTSHSYDEDVAQKVFKNIQSFIPEVEKLIISLQKIS